MYIGIIYICIMMIHEEDNESEFMYGHATVMERVKLYNMISARSY